MRYFFLLPLLLIGQLAFAQLDTLYIGVEKIPCQIEEITTDGIRFRKPQESFSRSCYQQVADSIRFSDGKVEAFRSLGQHIQSAAQYAEVPITTVPAEVAGMSHISNIYVSEESDMYLLAARNGAQVIFMHYGNTHGIDGDISTWPRASLYRRHPISSRQVREALGGYNRLYVDQLVKTNALTRTQPSPVQLRADIGYIREENGKVLVEAIIRDINGKEVFWETTPLQVNYLNKEYMELYSPLNYTAYRLLLKREKLSARPVRGIDDANLVVLTEVSADVQRLINLGQVGINVKNTVVNAYTNLKAKAAMMGGSVLYLDLAIDSKQPSALQAAVYTSQLPRFADFQTLIGKKRAFYTDQICQTSDSRADVQVEIKRLDLHIDSLYEEGGLIFVKGKLQDFKDVQTFRVTAFDQNGFYLYYTNQNNVYSCRIPLNIGSM